MVHYSGNIEKLFSGEARQIIALYVNQNSVTYSLHVKM